MSSIVEKFVKTSEEHSTRDALRSKTKTVTWGKYRANVERVAASLQYIGLKPGESVSILGFNSFEWFYSAMGALYAGGVFTGIYTTNGPSAIQYVLEKSDSKVLVAEKVSNELLEMLETLENPLVVVVLGENIKVNNPLVTSYAWDTFFELGEEPLEPFYGDADSLCSLIFTSGTTGNPKGVELTQKNIISAITMAMGVYEMDNERIVSYLPLSHVAAQVLDIFCHFYHKGTVYFAQPDALKGTLVNTLSECRPTLFFGVPRVWEKIEEKMRAVATEKYKGVVGGILYLVSLLGKSATSMWHSEQSSGILQLPVFQLPVYYTYLFYSNFIFSSIKAQLGLDQCKYFLTGAAPIKKSTLEYFSSIDILIMELYGMSETSGLISLQTPDNYEFGSCGIPVCEVKIASDGEILVKGDNVFRGYYQDEAATQETLVDGWLHTGDLGTIEKDRLFITGRKKELIITAGGENVAPVLIEDHLRRLVPEIESCVVVGDKQKFLSLLVTLKPEVDASSKHIQQGIDTYNEKFSISNAQKIQKFYVLPNAFSVETNELTPTLKLKRKVIMTKYQHEINEMYEMVK